MQKTLEVVDDYDGDTYRAGYSVKFEGRVYDLHCFHEKSKSRIRLPKPDIELIERRLKQVAAMDLLNIDQPKISRLMRGQLKEFSLEKLLRFLTRLDHDIEIVIKKKPHP